MADSIRLWLQNAGKYPLLTHDEIIDLAVQVQAWQTAENPDALTVKRGKRARNKIINGNLRLVATIAKKHTDRGLEFDVLCQEGVKGLARAAEKYDPTLGYQFSTYAHNWIKQAVTRAIAQDARTIRIPVHIYEKLCKVKKASRELTQELGRRPTVQEIAGRAKFTVEKVEQLLDWARNPLSLDAAIAPSGEGCLHEVVSDSKDEFGAIATEDVKERVRQALSILPARDRLAVMLRFGLETGQPLPLEGVSKELYQRGFGSPDKKGQAMSRERVRQIINSSLRRLKGNRDLKGLIA